jgi:phage repressor protein C with HTH and peptisase S24 domain
MFTHEDVWRAIDLLAKKHGLSTSALARKAGLDATSFNRSKRITPQGRPRWPSSESLAKVLSCTNTSLEEFTRLMTGERGSPPAPASCAPAPEMAALSRRGRALRTRIPLIGLARAGGEGYFDDGGYPVGSGWDEITCPGIADENAYALRIVGDSMEPVYREGDIIVVSPNSDVRRGDRVVVRLTGGEVMVKVLARRTGREYEFHSFNPDYPPRRVPAAEVLWMARILWASQ